MKKITLNIKSLPHASDLALPSYQSKGAAGFDLQAALMKEIILKPFERALIPTGLQIAIPEGYEGQIRPRSGLALKHGLTCLNTPGTIDSDYRGELQVLLINFSQETFTVSHGMRIAQMVISPVIQASFNEVETLDTTQRGADGFGSTGC